jgi:hypothetical protein
MFNLTPNTWLLLLFTVVPGFIANRIYALKCPSPKTDWEKAVLEPIACSVVNLVLWFPLVIPILRTPFEQIDEYRLMLAGFLVCLVSPALLALFWYWFRVRVLASYGLDHPTPRGWDYFLSGKRQFWVLFHLKNGKMVGGYFGAKSFASTYPQEPELYVEQVWRVCENGKFVEVVEGTAGAVLRQSDWDRIEFFEIQYEEQKDGAEIPEGADGAATPVVGGSTGTEPTGTEPKHCQPTEDRPAAGRIGDGTTTGPKQQTQEVGTNHVARQE